MKKTMSILIILVVVAVTFVSAQVQYRRDHQVTESRTIRNNKMRKLETVASTVPPSTNDENILEASDRSSEAPSNIDTANLIDATNQVTSLGQCIVGPEAAQGTCSRPTSLKLILNSCGDLNGPTVLNRTMTAIGVDISSYKNKTQYSLAWSYMASLDPDEVFLVGDNVYIDAVRNWGSERDPFGNNLAIILADASNLFLKYHGFLTQDNLPGPIFYSYLELLKDKLQDGYFDNEEFQALRAKTNNGIHVTWDDHDYFTNDESNPQYLRHKFRKAEIEALTGWDRNYFRFGVSHKGVERTWTKELADNKGNPFLIRFIILDEETTHNATQGCQYYSDSTSPTGFAPRLKVNSSEHCPDVNVMDDFDQENPQRIFFGDDQVSWFREQLMKPADLIFVINGGPNFEVDYAYTSLTGFPAEKRKFVQALRETGAEHVIFMGGDSHATYVTKVPNIVGYPLYTIIGSGLTQGLSYDHYASYYGDISHRFLVAAGSTNNNNAAACFAEVQILFDENGAFVRFTPHLREGVKSGDGWGPWYAQTQAFPDEPWAAQYDIRVSDLEIPEDWPRYHLDPNIPHKFVPENIYLKWGNTTGPADELNVTLTVTNVDGIARTFQMVQGTNCGEGYFGFCKDKWGAFVYEMIKVGTYVPSIVNQEICEHAGFVGDEIQWSIAENGTEVANGTTTMKIRNNILINSAGDPNDLAFYTSAEAYNPIGGDSVGIPVTDVIAEPELYGGYKVPVKGWSGSEFDDADVQDAYESWENSTDEVKDTTALMAAYLAAYYPDLPQL